jgi:two-component sensor histidine kinase
MPLAAYALWSGVACLLLGLATWACLHVWERFVRRETAALEAEIAAIEAAARDAEAAKRRDEQQRLLLAREVNHRAKNALAVAQAVVRLTPSSDKASAEAVAARIAALAGAHDLLADAEWQGAALRVVAERALAPFRGDGSTATVQLDGPEVMLHAGAVQPLSLLLHELATNAAKHGALAHGGAVTLRWCVRPPRLALRWTEAGVPDAGQPPDRRGFGSRLIETTVRDQLRGTLERCWGRDGLHCAVDLPLAGVAAAP